MVCLPGRNKSWAVSLVALTLAQVAASLLMPRGTALTIASDLIQGTLLGVATAAFLPNITRSRSNTFHARLFWILMSAGMLFWLSYQGMWNYFEVLKREDVPDPFLGDIVLFLHLVPMIAALALLPHLRDDERDERIRLLDFSLLLTWWIFVYVYLVIPWQTVLIDEPTYSNNFNVAYLTEKIVLLACLAVLAYTARGGWRHLYGQLLGAGALYASSSYVANWAIGHKTYYSGSIYDIPLTLSMAWMAAPAILAPHYDLSRAKPAKPIFGIWITRVSMLALFTLPWAALHAELNPSLPRSVKNFRIVVSLLTMVVMGVLVFWRQRLLGGELAWLLERSQRSFEDLKALQGQLVQSEKLASLGQLVGGAAHEINNPLTAMLGYSDLLSASNLPPHEKQQATNISEQVRRTKGLVSSLLTFAHQAPARLTAIDPNSVLQTAMRLVAPQLEEHAVVAHLELGSSLPAVLADSNQLLHVCLHLAGQIGAHPNSAKHAPLCVRTRQEGNSVVIDFHSGFPSSQPPFCNTLLGSEGANKPSTLSLSACCRIVEEHGGHILRPASNDIQAFRMELPIAPKAVPGQTSRAAAHSGF